jgi:FtsP/CotA-like multicopper oxidase with cupredoxin domain
MQKLHISLSMAPALRKSTDGGLLDEPVETDILTLAVSERAEILSIFQR